jgi:hypothetical protein
MRSLLATFIPSTAAISLLSRDTSFAAFLEQETQITIEIKIRIGRTGNN